jgi:hypothetical protein
MNKSTNTEWGLEIVWADKKEYGSKILLFNKDIKTDFVFHQHTIKSWFINTGKFQIRWIDTSNGKIFEKVFEEGNVFEIEKLKPYSVQCISKNGSITEVNNGIDLKDTYKVLAKEFL